jgi:hypothetical protein
VIRNAAGAITEDRLRALLVQCRRSVRAKIMTLTFRDDELDSESAPAKRDDYVVTGALLIIHEP